MEKLDGNALKDLVGGRGGVINLTCIKTKQIEVH